MNIAIDITPISEKSTSGHKVRGVGMYIKSLRESLLTHDKENKYLFFTKDTKIPENIDIVHYPYFDPFFFTLPAFRKHKTIVTIHDLTPLVFPEHFPAGIKGNLRWQLQKYFLQSIDGFLTDSVCSKNDIMNIVGLPEKKIDVVYLAANEIYKKIVLSSQQIRLLEKKYNLPEEFVLYVGDVTWNKNLPRLLKAIIQTKLPFVMVGKALTQENIDKTNPWNADVIIAQKLIENNKNIIRLGFVPEEDLVALYNRAKIFTMPSLYEGFGLPVVEAMRCGTPVITSKEGSLSEVAGEGAYFVNAQDTESIADGIEKVWNDKKLQKRLAEKGLQQAKKFSWKKTAEQTVAAYKKIYSA